MSVAWGTEQPVALLDWLGVTRRTLVPAGESELSDLVLLDLPDHDSTEVSHRLTVDRLVELVDMLVWVVDPQKYADAALHDGYLKPLVDHAEVMVVVLNQVDRLTTEQREVALADLRRLLDSQGLSRTRIMAMSAVTGEGVPELRAFLAEVAQAKAAKVQRFSADVTRRAGLLSAELGDGPVPKLTGGVVDRLNDSMAEAAAVPVVVDGVLKAWRHRGTIATGWPMVSWMKRFKPDPLRKLRLGLSPRELSPTDVSRTSLPKANSVQKAKMDASLRMVLDTATEGIPRGWSDQIRSVVRGNDKLLADRLDGAVAGTDLEMDRGHGWWVLATILQWLFFIALVVGVAWLALPFVLALAQVPVDLPLITWQGWPIQTLLAVGGIAGGVLLALLSRVFVEAGARVKARQARKALTDAVGEVTAVEIVEPIQAELDRLVAAREAVEKAR